MKVFALDVPRMSGRLVALGLTCFPLLGGAMADPTSSAARDSSAAVAPARPMMSGLLEIKFVEGQEIRLRNGRPVDVRGTALRGAATLRVFEQVARGEWRRSHDVSEETLEAMHAQGRLATGGELPDLNLYFRLRLPPGLDAEVIAQQLRTLPEVEAVHHVPAPAPLPTAPDYYTPRSSGSYQRYLDAAPFGIEGRYAATQPGGQGTNVRICDVEYSVNSSHVELGGITVVGPTPVDPLSNSNHGTAVAGIYGGIADGRGVTGITPAAQKLFAAANTASGYNIAAAITTCAANIHPGDVILIEQQTWGPQSTGSSDCYGCVPPEWYKPTYDAIKTVVAANRVVVETVGNGYQDLDSAIYSTGNGGHYPFLPQNDSGAIMVGAGTSIYYSSARTAHTYANYGSTLDLQGWGDSVVTAGYGDLFSADGVNGWYTQTFAGSSSAAPIVAGAVASLQGRHKFLRGFFLTPAQLRTTLRNTGSPQNGTKLIGPLPNLRAALDSIGSTGVCSAGGVSLAGGCWYLGGYDQSCNEVCANRGGYSSVTAAYVGTPAQGGSVSNCQQVLAALGYSGAVSEGSHFLALGCHRWNTGALYWLTSPALEPTAKTWGGAAQLVCACVN